MIEREPLSPEEVKLVLKSRTEAYSEMARASYIPLEFPDAVGTLINEALADPDDNRMTVRTVAESALSMQFASYRDAEFGLSYAITMARLRAFEQTTVTGEELSSLRSIAEECGLNPFKRKAKSTRDVMNAVESRVQQPDAITHISRLAQRGRGQR